MGVLNLAQWVVLAPGYAQLEEGCARIQTAVQEAQMACRRLEESVGQAMALRAEAMVFVDENRRPQPALLREAATLRERLLELRRAPAGTPTRVALDTPAGW